MDCMYGNRNLSNNNSEIEDEFDNCIDDKTCVYETVIRGGYIKQEPCDTEDQPGSIHSNANIKEEIIEDPTVLVEETRLLNKTKENYCCASCGEEYDLYCLKCPMLIRIFDSNNPDGSDNTVRRTLPKGFIDISETPSGVGVVVLRTIPKGIMFGPFEGLHSSKDDTVSKWKLKNKELVYTKDPKRLNWMQYIRRANRSSLRNLISFQYEDALYYRSDCHINAGDELLVCWDSDNGENENQDMENSYWKPRVCERLDDTYACTLCCVGYNSICHLAAHNSVCPEKRNEMDFCKEIIQCAFCKIYMDMKEYSDYHMDRCCERNTMKYVTTPRSPEDSDKSKLKNKHKCTMCEYSTSLKNNFKKHQLTHTDLRMHKCPECPYQARTKGNLEEHARRHANPSRSRFECEHCGEGFTRSDIFVLHQKKKHSVSVYKCDKCVFQTSSGRDLERHLATHKDDKPYRCNKCDKRYKLEKTLLRHVGNSHNEKKKKYKCPKCDFESIHPGCVKKHLLNIHSGVKRFKCPRCPFKTCNRETFDQHIRYHEDVKPIKCKTCDMEFWSTKLLSRHEKEVHPITNFACTICSYKSTKKSNLKRHISIRHS